MVKQHLRGICATIAATVLALGAAPVPASQLASVGSRVGFTLAVSVGALVIYDIIGFVMFVLLNQRRNVPRTIDPGILAMTFLVYTSYALSLTFLGDVDAITVTSTAGIFHFAFIGTVAFWGVWVIGVLAKILPDIRTFFPDRGQKKRD